MTPPQAFRRAGVALVAVLVAGCGSSGPHLSKAEYTSRATAICQRYQGAIVKLGQPTRITDIGPFIAKALPELTKTVDALGKLAPPESLQSEYEKFMAAARATVARAKALRDAAAAADGSEVQRLLKDAAKATSARVALADAAGLGACALN
jgi:hypothetical protein